MDAHKLASTLGMARDVVAGSDDMSTLYRAADKNGNAMSPLSGTATRYSLYGALEYGAGGDVYVADECLAVVGHMVEHLAGEGEHLHMTKKRDVVRVLDECIHALRVTEGVA